MKWPIMLGRHKAYIPGDMLSRAGLDVEGGVRLTNEIMDYVQETQLAIYEAAQDDMVKSSRFYVAPVEPNDTTYCDDPWEVK